ncbi:hypothetical protein HDF08_004230 [Edaphobacter lichenicola]|uniref:Uncharacterized protein n=1 Tax=Tunturiibacter lichenicola TaxID=2051959 RepID=A0A852VLR6_9BACT|nr:hypothetical protein [Edaphobacter lichenicola]
MFPTPVSEWFSISTKKIARSQHFAGTGLLMLNHDLLH